MSNGIAQPSEFSEGSIALAIEYEKVLSNDVEAFFDSVNKFSDGFTSQVVKNMFAVVNNACEEAGQVVRQSEHASTAKAYLVMLEKIEFGVDKIGPFSTPSFYIGPTRFESFKAELDSQGDEFRQEVARIMKEKTGSRSTF